MPPGTQSCRRGAFRHWLQRLDRPSSSRDRRRKPGSGSLHFSKLTSSPLESWTALRCPLGFSLRVLHPPRSWVRCRRTSLSIKASSSRHTASPPSCISATYRRPCPVRSRFTRTIVRVDSLPPITQPRGAIHGVWPCSVFSSPAGFFGLESVAAQRRSLTPIKRLHQPAVGHAAAFPDRHRWHPLSALPPPLHRRAANHVPIPSAPHSRLAPAPPG
jgi:hypothetical protein